MPIVKAAIKHLRKSQKLRVVNRGHKARMKQVIKDMFKLADAKKMDELAKKLPEAMSIIDKATKKNLLHKNTASRKKSQLSKLLVVAK